MFNTILVQLFSELLELTLFGDFSIISARFPYGSRSFDSSTF